MCIMDLRYLNLFVKGLFSLLLSWIFLWGIDSALDSSLYFLMDIFCPNFFLVMDLISSLVGDMMALSLTYRIWYW